MTFMIYLLLLSGAIPSVLILGLYFLYIHPKRNQLWISFKRLSLPNVIATVSLAVAIVAFLYSILYSSISTFITLEALRSADEAGKEQKAAFNKQLDLMVSQQKTLESTKRSLSFNTTLAKNQVKALQTSVETLKKMVETSKSELLIVTEQRNEQIASRRLRPIFELRFIPSFPHLGLTVNELKQKQFTLKPTNGNFLFLTFKITNKGNGIGRNVVLTGVAYPETVSLSHTTSGPSVNTPNVLTSTDYSTFLLFPSKEFLFEYEVYVPNGLNKFSLNFKIDCDDPTLAKDFAIEFPLDWTKPKNDKSLETTGDQSAMKSTARRPTDQCL